MTAIDFKPCFYEKIRQGLKKQTIRKLRKNPIKTDGKLSLFTGLRTKQCKLIARSTVKSIHNITINANGVVFIDDIEVVGDDLHELALADGFETDRPFQQFINFFRDHYELPFTGVLIKWN
jgi:hypothetical protein